jgi:uncharacterized RDD family membrane protein YckC
MTEVVTGEAVVLDVPVATFPSRMAALLIDMAVQVVALAVLGILVAVSSGQLNGAATAAISLCVWVAVIVGYPTVFETLSRGKTLGKMALGVRVVSDDGGPERFRQALIRALAGIFEIWSLVLDPVALITSMVSARGKRLGDMFAGTYVVLDRVPRRRDLPAGYAVMPPPLAGWAQLAELSRLSDRDAEAASSYLRRLSDLHPAAREEIGARLAATVAAQVSPPPPPGTPPAAYLAAVLAVRRQRDQARLAAQHPSPDHASPPAAAPDPANPDRGGPAPPA